jgi:catechol 2,3-dioxygenase-like lactoylglutathione lyase family enzyme
MSLSELFHVGIVVPDLGAARARFTELLGIEWGPEVGIDNAMFDADGKEIVVPLRMCYSTSAPYLELIEEQPGSPWVCNEHSNLHHIGYYSDTLLDDSGRLTAARCPLEYTGRDDKGERAIFAYHRDPLGVRIEWVDAANKASFGFLTTKPS